MPPAWLFCYCLYYDQVLFLSRQKMINKAEALTVLSFKPYRIINI